MDNLHHMPTAKHFCCVWTVPVLVPYIALLQIYTRTTVYYKPCWLRHNDTTAARRRTSPLMVAFESPQAQDANNKLGSVLGEFGQAVDPLVRLQFVVANTTAGERCSICQSGHVFMDFGPSVAAPPSPIGLPAAVAHIGDPGAVPSTIRFSGAQQIANWIADVQKRPYASAGPQNRMMIQLTSDKCRNWSENVDIYA